MLATVLRASVFPQFIRFYCLAPHLKPMRGFLVRYEEVAGIPFARAVRAELGEEHPATDPRAKN
jgi:hypothetical protein